MAETGGELLARCLANEGVRFVFGLPSPEVDPFLAALEANRIRFVPVRHESAAVYMAEGLYKSTGQVAATVTNPGPGSANLIPGIINARHEGVPLVAITAQHRMDIVYPSPPSTFQGQDQLDVFRPAVKWGAPIFSWARIPEIVQMAFREMWNGRPGPVQLEIPAPVMYATGEAPRIAPPESYRSMGPQAGTDQIKQAAQLLRAAKRPLIVTGSGVDRANAGVAVVELAAQLGCPVVASMAGRSSVPQDHAHHLYGYGAGADMAKSEADVVLALGTRLGNLDTPYDKYWGDQAKQKLIQIDVDPRSLGVTRRLALGIVSNLDSALTALAAELSSLSKRPNAAPDLARYREAEQLWRKTQFADANAYNGPGLHPGQVMQAIGRNLGREAIYVADGGYTSLWAHFMLPPTRARSYLNILELGMLGIGIPSAIGAKLGNPERDVVCVSGDGAAGFHCMELQTAAREGLKIIAIVFADGSWTMEVPNQKMRYGRTFGTEMGTVRWDKVAEGLGCKGYYAESMTDLEKSLLDARGTAGPALICVRTDRDANMSVPLATQVRFGEVYNGVSG